MGSKVFGALERRGASIVPRALGVLADARRVPMVAGAARPRPRPRPVRL